MAFITSCYLTDAFLIVASFILVYYLKFKLISRYFWKKRNVPYTDPMFILGNTPKTTILEPLATTIDRFYFQHKNEKLYGIFTHTRPTLLVNDVGLIKQILVKDFQHFHDRGIRVNTKQNPLDGHLFSLNGSQWRNLRVKLTPTFTSGKMKMMFPTMVACGEELQTYLEPLAQKEETIEIKDVLARFTTDIISSCAFGIESNSLKNPDSEFRVYGRKLFQPGYWLIFLRTLGNNFPIIKKFITIPTRPKEVTEFFLNAVRDIMDHREKNNIHRKDFMDLLIQLKNKGRVDGVDADNGERVGSGDEFTFDVAAAQAFVFFIAGFETSSTTMQFALYELAKNPNIQVKLQEEIDKVLAKHDNKVTYDAVQEMDYLDGVVNESLRKYPPVPILLRECTKDYTFPGTNVSIEKGTSLMLPIMAIQNDPEYFPNPERFDPTRFSAEEKAKRDHFLHLPFGEGPRICIGNRFGLLQSKTGLIFLLSRYSIEFSEKTPTELKYDSTSFIPTPKGGMFLKITKRNH